MLEDVLYRKKYSDFSGEHDKDDIYTLSINRDEGFNGRFKIKNLAIYYAFTIYCDLKEGKFTFNEAYFQDAHDIEYKKQPVGLDRVDYYAEDLNDFINEFLQLLEQVVKEEL